MIVPVLFVVVLSVVHVGSIVSLVLVLFVVHISSSVVSVGHVCVVRGGSSVLFVLVLCVGLVCYQSWYHMSDMSVSCVIACPSPFFVLAVTVTLLQDSLVTPLNAGNAGSFNQCQWHFSCAFYIAWHVFPPSFYIPI